MLSQTLGPSGSVLPTLTCSISPGFQAVCPSPTWRCWELNLGPYGCKAVFWLFHWHIFSSFVNVALPLYWASPTQGSARAAAFCLYNGISAKL